MAHGRLCPRQNSRTWNCLGLIKQIEQQELAMGGPPRGSFLTSSDSFNDWLGRTVIRSLA